MTTAETTIPIPVLLLILDLKSFIAEQLTHVRQTVPVINNSVTKDKHS